ncbi:MAG: AAA family ATPase [Polyangiaceae bacterium]
MDEPEMNAHPRAQAALLELLGMLVNHGVRVVLTTHSPYFVDHLTNLMEGSTLGAEQQETLAGKLFLRDKAALLSPEDVSVYVFEDTGREVRSRLAIDRATREIDWTTFSEVSDEVSNLLSEILEMKRGGG